MSSLVTKEESNIENLKDVNLFTINIDELLEITSHEKFPKALNYNFLLATPIIENKTKGGLYLSEETMDSALIGNNIGRIISIGSTVGEGKAGSLEAVKQLKVGDYVNYNPHATMPVKHFDIKFLVASDNALMVSVPDPNTQTDAIFKNYNVKGLN